MKRISLPDETTEAILQHGEIVRRLPPESLLRVTEWWVLSSRDMLSWFLPNSRFGMTLGRKVFLTKRGRDSLQREPYDIAPKAWHELVHVAQFEQHGTITFLFDYSWGFVRHLGNWRQIYLEEEALRLESAMRERML